MKFLMAAFVALAVMVPSIAEANGYGQAIVQRQVIRQPIVRQRIVQRNVVQRQKIVVQQQIVQPAYVQQFVAQPAYVQQFVAPQQLIVPQVQQFYSVPQAIQGGCQSNCPDVF